MKDVSAKLSLIASAWNQYFWDLKYCQKSINFTEDIQTNYFGDILHYFRDTFQLLSITTSSNEYHNHIFDTIGLLQTLYVQQDLVSELLYIFKFDKDKILNEDSVFREIRNLRNELVGHPIRRATSGNELISSVFWGRQLSRENIHYILYSRESNFSGIEKSFSKKDILSKQAAFLNKYLDLIL